MSLFPFIHFFNTIVYLFLAAYIYMKNPEAPVNRICVVTFFSLGFWSSAMIFVHSPHSSKDMVMKFINIGSIGWIGFSSLFLWFILVFSEKKKILKKKWVYLLLFGIPLVFIYQQWTNNIYIDLTKHYFGWKAIFNSNSIWPYLLIIYYISTIGTALYLNFNVMRDTRRPILKKQAKVIFGSVLIALLIGLLNDMIFPLMMKVYITPDIADSIALIWAFGVVYAMRKYKFLTITPATASDNIISTMYDCLILIDIKGDIVTINKSTADLLEYKVDELDGLSVNSLFTGEEQERGLINEIIKNGTLKNREFLFKTKKGKEIPVLFSSSVLRDDAGAVGGIVCVAKDISERKKLEEEILKGKKLESIGYLAGGIAHDFNNLLSIIIGNISLLRDEISPGGKLHKYLVNAENASLKAADLAMKFITFSPNGLLKKEKIRLSDFLENVKDSEFLKSNQNILYNYNIPDDLMPVYGDRRQLMYLMENLFLNAVEAIEALPAGGGKISVRAENTTREDTSELKDKNKFLLKKGKYVKIIIEDNGIGIPPGYIDKIFDPYFSTKNKSSQKGLGLGLTLCYSIIKKHDGYIAVESTQEKGTTITLYLPVFEL